MSDRGRVVLIFAAVAAVAGGAGYYFFQIHQPAQRLEDARAEIAVWEARYQEARGCLLGKTPASAKTSEALAIREMDPDPWDRGRCTPVVGKLSRGEANDTGVDAVEAAWAELDRAAQQAALAFAKHVGTTTTLANDPLPGALDALDAARGKLRAAAELPASAQAGAALPVAEIVPLVDGTEPVIDLDIAAPPSAHGAVAFGKTAARQVQIVLPVGGAPQVGRVGPGAMRGVPDTSWGADAGRLVARGRGKAQDAIGKVTVGAMNEEGVIATPATLDLTAPVAVDGNAFEGGFEPGEEVGSIMLAAAAGSLVDGTLVYGSYQTLVVARAKDRIVTAGTPIKIDTAIAAADLDGRLAVVWSTLDKVHKALLVHAGDEQAFELPDRFEGSPCLTKDRVWLVGAGSEVYAFAGGRPLARVTVPPYSQLVGCTADAALVRTRSTPRELAICTNECRTVNLPSGAPDNAAVTAVDGKLRAIAAHGGVLGVWREDGPPVFYALPVPAVPARGDDGRTTAISDGKVIDIVAQGAGSMSVIRIPAR